MGEAPDRESRATTLTVLRLTSREFSSSRAIFSDRVFSSCRNNMVNASRSVVGSPPRELWGSEFMASTRPRSISITTSRSSSGCAPVLRSRSCVTPARDGRSGWEKSSLSAKIFELIFEFSLTRKAFLFRRTSSSLSNMVSGRLLSVSSTWPRKRALT